MARALGVFQSAPGFQIQATAAASVGKRLKAHAMHSGAAIAPPHGSHGSHGSGGSGGVRGKGSSDACSEGTKLHQHGCCFECRFEVQHWRLRLAAASVLRSRLPTFMFARLQSYSEPVTCRRLRLGCR